MTDDAAAIAQSFDHRGYPAAFLAAYEPLKCLAHGEGGETLLVRGRADDELYIAKTLPAGAFDEGELLERLSHPRLPRLAARFAEGDARVFVREYVEGLPLDEAVNGRPLSDGEAEAVAVQLCDALRCLHTQTPPVIHRDVKPQNVILCPDGSVKLIDFGISRTYKADARRDTVFSGTNDFAPPEQYGFAQTDARADIYSLGMLLKYLLTGGEMDRPIENRRLRRIVRRCTRLSPGARYASAVRVKRALLADSPKHRRRVTAGLAAAMLMLGVALGRFAVPYVEGLAAAAADDAREYARAVDKGFVPPELAAAEPDKTVVTWAQFCSMLGTVISACDEALLPAWEDTTRAAPDTAMRRDGGMVALLFAAELMGCDHFNAPEPEGFSDYAPRVWQVVTMDYPVFDFRQPKEITRDCYDDNYVGPAYDFCLRRVSELSGKSLLEFDRRGDLRLSEPLTLREAALAALRLYESAV